MAKSRTEVNIWKIEIRREGKRFGWLWLEKKYIYWKPVNKKVALKITWKDFDDFMRNRE